MTNDTYTYFWSTDYVSITSDGSTNLLDNINIMPTGLDYNALNITYLQIAKHTNNISSTIEYWINNPKKTAGDKNVLQGGGSIAASYIPSGISNSVNPSRKIKDLRIDTKGETILLFFRFGCS